MAKLWVKTLNISSKPAGAAAAARQGNLVMIVDVIDMATTAEAALEAGAIDVFGASPDKNEVPVTVNPEKIGYFAGKKSLKNDTGVVIAAEPRLFSQNDQKTRMNGIQQVVKGIERAGGSLFKVVSNIGKEITELVELEGKILVVVSPAGGAAFDAAYNYGAPEVITGTIARTKKMCGDQPALTAARRAIK
ncbi:MAG: hypothetical protein ACOCZ3_00865, partial [Bacillota bacterium]